jgi:hypothetical protein
MRLLALKLLVTEDDINALLAEFPPRDSVIENLRVRLTPEGLVVLGDYPTVLLKMAFETLWQLTASGSVVEARLANVKVAGLPAKMLRGVLLKTIRDMTADQPGFAVGDETIRVDLAQHSGWQKLRLDLNLKGVHCGAGEAVIEAGPPTA